MTTIRFLSNYFGNYEGDEVRILHEEDNAYYYYDIFGRWCYVLKDDEGKDYEVVNTRHRSK